MSTATLIYFIMPNSLELFVVVRHWRRSWTGQPQPGGIRFLRKKIDFYFRFYLNKRLVLQRPLQNNLPQPYLMNMQVKISPNIIWGDRMVMGSTIGCYMMRRWYENLSLDICRVNGKTTLTRYTPGRWEDDDGNTSPNLTQGMLRFISYLIWKGELIFISAPIWKRRYGAWEGGLISWIKNLLPRNNNKKNPISELRHERGLHPQIYHLWRPS